MKREEKIDWLIQYLKKENAGYAAIQEPVNLVEKRRLLRSLMNVRWPMEASDKFYEIQDALLKEELAEKGIVDADSLSTVAEQYPEAELRNPDASAFGRGISPGFGQTPIG